MGAELMAHRSKHRPDADLLVVRVERRDVEESDIRPVLAELTLLLDAGNVSKYLGRVDLSFAGYGSEPRELCQIPEVREWMAKLDKAFPYWFAFLNKSSHSMSLVAFALCPISKLPDGSICIAPRSLHDYVRSHFAAVNELVEQGLLTEEDDRAVEEGVIDYLAGEARPGR
jgi:hypothetical protein